MWMVAARLRALNHPTRRRIYDHLLVLPGDYFRSIARTLALQIGAARHHLNILLRAGIVREEKGKGRCRYYASGERSQPDRNSAFMQHWSLRDLRLRVLFVVRSKRATTPSDVARILGISRQLAAYHLVRLAELGLVGRDVGLYRA